MSEFRSDPGGHFAPWEKIFGKVLTPFEDFIHKETAGSVILIVCTAAALILANSPLSDDYQALIHTHIVFRIGPWTLDYSLHHWINDGLMALFFFVVGLEIKREVLTGDLSDPRAALLPILAAIGGMVFPGVIYYLLNQGQPSANGWGIPMATDIAFAVGILALLGKRVPRSLFTFLVALAIVDDLGAVAVIAIFYTEQIDPNSLLLASGFLAVLIALNLFGIRSPIVHFFVALGLWLAMLQSGIHATIAGILAAWTVPNKPKLSVGTFSQLSLGLMTRFRATDDPQDRKAILQALEDGVKQVESPLQRLEHNLHGTVAFIIIPLFAVANAGILIELEILKTAFNEPVVLGITAGLLGGKLLGIICYVTHKLGLAFLPPGCRMSHIVGVSFLAAIGFTMSIFIAELAFRGNASMLLDAKVGILGASVVAGSAGYIWLRAIGRKPGV